jgi:hypothetical protein
MIPTLGAVVAAACRADPEFLPALRTVLRRLSDADRGLEIMREIRAHVQDQQLPDEAARVETIVCVIVALNNRNLGSPLFMNDEIMAAWVRQGIGSVDCRQCTRCEYVAPAAYQACPACGGVTGEFSIPSEERWGAGRWKN